MYIQYDRILSLNITLKKYTYYVSFVVLQSSEYGKHFYRQKYAQKSNRFVHLVAIHEHCEHSILSMTSTII